MRRINGASALLAWTLLGPGTAAAQTAGSQSTGNQRGGHITGIGGVFVKSANPAALAAWYRDMLGIKLETWGGAILRTDAPGHPPMALWSAFAPDSSEFVPSKRDFMVNFAVDDLDAFVGRLRQKGVAVLKQDDSDPNGKFAWILDPDGTKIELWQPKAK